MLLQTIFRKALTSPEDFPRRSRGIPEFMSRTSSVRRKITGIPALALTALTILASCSEWTDTESIPVESIHPWESEPELWEEYKADLKDYKSHEHSIVYARFENSPENPVSEKGSLRSLPDSLDIVSLINAENFSKSDAEDMAWMKSIGTKVLYQIDFAANPDILADGQRLETALDRAAATVLDYGLDGFSFTGLPKNDGGLTAAASETVVGRLSEAAGTDGLLVFEGNPVFISDENLGEIDLFVLGSETAENSFELRNMVQDARDAGIPADKILLAADFDGIFYDDENVSADVLTSMADYVVSLGPLAGLALYNIESDYYSLEGNWLTVRSLISRLNP